MVCTGKGGRAFRGPDLNKTQQQPPRTSRAAAFFYFFLFCKNNVKQLPIIPLEEAPIIPSEGKIGALIESVLTWAVTLLDVAVGIGTTLVSRSVS